MENANDGDYEEMDEAEEEALLRSDDELDTVKMNAKSTLNTLASGGLEEDSLMAEAAALDDQCEVEKGISEDDDDESESANHVQKALIEKDNDSGDDDTDDDELDEADKVLIEYRNTLKELESNQYAYDKYVRLCELSHLTADLDNIRNAYNLFACIYPLSAELWLKYLSIEVTVAQSVQELEKLVGLFRRALSDYFSTDIAREYAALAPRVADPESIWHEILGTYALHCLQGREFFVTYRAFIASQTQKSAEAHQQAYINSFLRELKLPLYNMEESYIEFKVFYEKNKSNIAQQLDWEAIDRDYFKAKEHMEKILPFERQLEAIDAKCYRERAEVYLNYIKLSDKFLDENVLQTVYERMVADCCLNVDCWLTYIDFIEYRDEYGRPKELQDLPVFQQDVVDINKRALRNCTWSERLYIKRMQLLEKQERPREQVQEVLESSMVAGFQTAEQAVAVWLEYLTYLRRQTDWQNEDECDILRKNFNLAWTILGQQWGVLADCNCEILQFWGRLEYGPLQDAKRGKELWTTVMESSDNSTKSGLWIEYAQLEMRIDLETTRKIYRKALHAAGLDNPAVISSAWERFERCNGSVKSLNACRNECTAYLAQLAVQQPHVSAKPSKPQFASTSPGKGMKRKTGAVVEVSDAKKVKTQETHTKVFVKPTDKVAAGAQQKHHEMAFKEHENQEIDLSKDHLRIFLSNLDYNLTEDDIRAGLPELKVINVNLIRSANGRSRGFGYLELESAAEVEKALALDRRTLNGRPLFISSVLRDKQQRQKFKYSDGIEPKKLFVKGLPQDVKKEELEEIFLPYGKLADIRLVYHKSGKFKNIAYVEYEEEHAAAKAVLATDELELRGHTLSVAISAPPPKSGTTAPPVNAAKLLGISTRRSKPKLYDQKPRLSLIPSAVRKRTPDVGKLPAPSTASTTGLSGGVSAQSSSTNGTVGSTKSNDDFRKLLLK